MEGRRGADLRRFCQDFPQKGVSGYGGIPSISKALRDLTASLKNGKWTNLKETEKDVVFDRPSRTIWCLEKCPKCKNPPEKTDRALKSRYWARERVCPEFSFGFRAWCELKANTISGKA